MKKLLKILSYPVSIVFYLVFGLVLLIFHGIQWICLKGFGYQAHKKSVDILNWFLLRCLNILGTRFKIDIKAEIPEKVPVIIVSNHQSMWDIPPIIWHLRKYHPKFISKKALGKGIPSISFNLKYGGSVLIDRGDSSSSLDKIRNFAHYLVNYHRAGVIFPEGTRSRDGIPKRFKKSGLYAMIEEMPGGYIIPVTINNSWKLQKNGMFPMPLGVRFEMTAHQALRIADFEMEKLTDKVETIITSKIHR